MYSMKERMKLIDVLAQKSTHCTNLRKETETHKSCEEKLRMDGVQCKRTCCSSCTPIALHKSQVGVVL